MTNKEAIYIMKDWARGVEMTCNDDVVEAFHKAIEALEVTDVEKKISKDINDAAEKGLAIKEDVISEALKKYGITKENVMEWLGRIRVETFDDLSSGVRRDRWYIDCVYKFTVLTYSEITITYNDILISTRYKVIEEDLGKENK